MCGNYNDHTCNDTVGAMYVCVGVCLYLIMNTYCYMKLFDCDSPVLEIIT